MEGRNNSPVAVALREWISNSSSSLTSNDYLESAVDLSLFLSARLGSLTEEAVELSDDDNGVDLQHVTADDVIVHLERSRTDSRLFESEGNYRAITSVDIKPTSKAREAAIRSPLDQREVCVALGMILLKVFSKGNLSNSPVSVERTTDGMRYLTLRSNDTATTNEASTAVQPAVKRRPFEESFNYLQGWGMPFAICRLVSDLLHATSSNNCHTDELNANDTNLFFNSTTTTIAPISLVEAQYDLAQMKHNPEKFLYDCTCPKKALEETRLFAQSGSNAGDIDLYGREDEIQTLMDAVDSVSSHTRGEVKAAMRGDSPSSNQGEFFCEAIFLSGYSGGGKSSLIHHVVHTCKKGGWFVMSAKFDRQVAPLMSVRNDRCCLRFEHLFHF
jgi:hypothetical protein